MHVLMALLQNQASVSDADWRGTMDAERRDGKWQTCLIGSRVWLTSLFEWQGVFIDSVTA